MKRNISIIVLLLHCLPSLGIGANGLSEHYLANEEISSLQENFSSKRALASEICEYIESIKPSSQADYELLGNFITLANPNLARSSSITERFPALQRLVQLEREGAKIAIESIFVDAHTNPKSLPLNIAYVLSHTVSLDESAQMIERFYEGAPALDENQVDVLNEIKRILELQHQSQGSEVKNLFEIDVFRVREVEVIEELAVEVPSAPTFEEVAEVIEEKAAPEPAIEEPAEVVFAESTEEPAEEPSQWWLWLIGALVVVGGVGLIARRKS